MRICLRVIAVLIGLEIVQTILLIWQMTRFGGLGELARAGAFGLITMLGWLLALVVGPFAVKQLWRLRESGRRASLLLALFALVYYAAGVLVFRGSGAETSKIAVPILGNTLLSVLLVSSPAKRICRNVEALQNPELPLPSAP
jgi:hypothetical protein